MSIKDERNLFKPIVKECYTCSHSLIGQVKKCYACKNDLVGTLKEDEGYSEEWECYCEVYECECKTGNNFYCPLCNGYFEESEYLASAIHDTKVRWLANMITHYRHGHIKSWNKMWHKDSGPNYKKAAKFNDENYEDEKKKVNERAKRQIIRKALKYLKEQGITKQHFLALQNNEDEKTLELIDAMISNH